MMGIYIKGMDMPKSCYDCPLQDDECFGSIKCCYAQTWGSANMRAVDCPLVPVPPHGELIERDAAYDKIAEQEGGYYVDMDAVDKGLEATPVIIPAEEEE